MNLVNETPFEAGWTVGYRGDGREVVIVAIKATYQLAQPLGDGQPRMAEMQQPIRKADEFATDPAYGAPLFETDLAHDKVACDVLLHGQAHAPFERAQAQLLVSMRVGTMAKSMRVTGPRVWTKMAGFIGTSAPRPFVSQRISYESAFGGVDVHPQNEERIATYLDNPAGRGFRKFNFELDGVLMPVTEAPDDPIEHPGNEYRPMSYGPLGRSWRPRARYAGTYDEAWLSEQAPLWPTDFDPRYFQAAPEDQQISFPQGGEPIELINLVPASLAPNGRLRAQLPKQRIAVAFELRREPPCLVEANLDTVLIEPDENRFSCTWRARKAMTRDVFDVEEVIVGDRVGSLPGRLRAKLKGKKYLRGLGELTRKKGPR